MGETRELKRLLTLRRAPREQVRWSLDEFDTPDGRTARYVSARKWARGTDGEWRPTRVGLTIRLSELGEVMAALGRISQSYRDGETKEGQET